jgi:hypothetical protein
MKATGVVWFNSGEAIGLVTVETEYDGEKAYIKSVSGVNMEADIINVAQWGAKFPIDVAKDLVKTMGTPVDLEIK